MFNLVQEVIYFVGQGPVELGQGLILHPQIHQGTDVGHDGLYQVMEPRGYLPFFTSRQLKNQSFKYIPE